MAPQTPPRIAGGVRNTTWQRIKKGGAGSQPRRAAAGRRQDPPRTAPCSPARGARGQAGRLAAPVLR